MLKKRVKGCYDLYPDAQEHWQHPQLWDFLNKKLKELASLYAFQQVVTPTFEYTDIFLRSSGEESDIVSKEMYTFLDKKGRSLSLRPELTAPVIRAYLENNGQKEPLSKLYYQGPCFRYNRAQKGRYRQFQQFGIEVLGAKNPLIDIEVIAMLCHLYELLNLKNTTLLINTIGSIECRKKYSTELISYYEQYEHLLSEDSKRRLKSNPLRILDSKDVNDIKISANAPKIIDHIDQDAKNHFNQVLEGLNSLGIKYEIDHHLVRGLDYYSDTVFELVKKDDHNAQNTLAAGGVYDGLVKTLGGKDTPGIGFAMGMERTIQYMIEENVPMPDSSTTTLYAIGLDQPCKKYLLTFLMNARKKGIAGELFEGSNLKTGLKRASQKKASYAIILGEDEYNQGLCKIKDLESRKEETLQLSNLESWISKNNPSQLAMSK